jgi:hypothetical protein
MKSVLIFCLMMTLAGVSDAANIRMLQDDAFSTQEKADESAKIINQNFSELFAVKVSLEDNLLTEPRYYVTDLFDPEEADYNAFVIMENADDLWRGKQENGGSIGTRSFQISELEDQSRTEENIAAINQIFFDLDDAKIE